MFESRYKKNTALHIACQADKPALVLMKLNVTQV